MVHAAYDAAELVRGAPTKIEVAATYGSKILAGCADGSLRIFAPLQEDSDQGEGIQRGGYVQEKAVSMFWEEVTVGDGGVSFEASSDCSVGMDRVSSASQSRGRGSDIKDEVRERLCVG